MEDPECDEEEKNDVNDSISKLEKSLDERKKIAKQASAEASGDAKRKGRSGDLVNMTDEKNQ